MTPDQDILARTLYGEAEAWDHLDATAIAHVVLNRVDLPNWPSTIRGVCMQPWQFSCWNTDNPRRTHLLEADGATYPWLAECFKIAAAVIAGHTVDPTNRATHYYASYMKTAPKWAKGKTPSFIDTKGEYQHLYFNDIDTPPPHTPAEALDQERPIGDTRTASGAATATIGVVLTALGEQLQETAKSVEMLVPYLDAAKWVFLGLTALGIFIVAYARISDRIRGLR